MGARHSRGAYLSQPDHDLEERARRVRLLCVDVDGVLTDAGMYYGADGEVLKKFNTRDGMGLARVREAGIAVAIISGEDSAIVHARASSRRPRSASQPHAQRSPHTA